MTQQNKLEWNLGGWLGGQLGGSAWILLAGLFTLPKNLNAGLMVIGLFCVVNIVGSLLWRRRETVSALAGMQILLAVIGVCGLAAVYLLDRVRVYEAIQAGGTVSASSTYFILLLMIPALMLIFYIRFGRK